MYDYVSMMITKYKEFLDMKGDALNAADKNKCTEHLKVFEEVKQIYDASEEDPSNKVMEKMMTL